MGQGDVLVQILRRPNTNMKASTVTTPEAVSRAGSA